ncbi:MAG: double-strand break repair protein AddB [Paracoccaceae bacterium]
MFSDAPGPRVFFLPPGAAFARGFAEGLRARLAGAPPEALARVRIYLNARRTARAVEATLEAAGPATWLPEVRLFGALEAEARAAGLPAAPSRLRRDFALLRLTEAFLARETGFGPAASAPGLATSLRTLLDELQAGGVTAAELRALDLAEHAEHWRRAADFLAILAEHWPRHLAEAEGGAPDPETRRRAAVRATAEAWAARPPATPVLAAGSTGSTPATAELLSAVARLPQGAVVLPGWDPEMPAEVWETLAAGERPEHPHHHLVRLVAGLGPGPRDPAPWLAEPAPSPARLALTTQALRPAPVTDAWAAALPALAAGAEAATADLTWTEAASPREEAAAIAALLAEAAHRPEGVAALVTPDRALARRVASELSRWGIVPDDSAGTPLSLTPPGVALGLLAGSVGRPLETRVLAALLRHPLIGGRGEARKRHVRMARALERRALRGGPAEIDWERLRAAARPSDDPERERGRPPAPEGFGDWFAWLRGALAPLAAPAGDAAEAARRHRAAAEALSRGPDPGAAPGGSETEGDGGPAAAGPEGAAPSGEAGRAPVDAGAATDAAVERAATPPLWEKEAGRRALAFAEAFLEAAEAAPGAGASVGYGTLWGAFAAGESVTEPAPEASSRVKLLGTLEARAETADLVILGGLNEGVWPPAPGPDPWLGRELRARLGLAPPEARTGLSAHDFLQAANAPRVVLTRAVRDDAGPTVASRWLARLEALLKGADRAAGFDPERGEGRLAAVRRRGAAVLRAVEDLDFVADDDPRRAPAARPEPRPPLAARPRRFSVTEIETLVRDPYAVYARRVLDLARLDPLGRDPDARDRGTILHAALERFGRATRDWPESAPPARLAEALVEAAEAALAERAPWPAERRLWLARFRRAADWFAEAEAARRAAGGRILALETRGRVEVAAPEGPVTLRARADRLDRLPGGALAIYDYKTGAPPTARQIRAFSRQLLLEGLIAEAGGFEGIEAATVAELEYVGVTGSGEGGKAQAVDLSEVSVAETRAELARLLADYDREATPYRSRIRPQFIAFAGDYDRLARRGEWPETGEAGE